MRLRLAVRWAGDTIEDRLHDGRELRVGAGADDEVTVAGDDRAPIRFVELRELTVLELPAALVSSIEWTDGSTECVDEDRRITLGGARRAGCIVLRQAPLSELPTSLHFELEQEAPRRSDFALIAWAGGALALAAYLGVSVVAVQSSMSGALLAPHELGAGEISALRVRMIIDQSLPLVDEARTNAMGEKGLGGAGAHRRPGAREASRYASLLVQGFDRYVAGDLDAAQQQWSEASFLDSERPEAWVNLAQIAKRRQQVDEEQRLLRVALSHDPDRCEALVSMALVEARLGALERGAKTIARARARCGGQQGFVLLNEAALLAAGGQLDAALARLEAALHALPSDDKRQEALADLQHEPLFANLRSDARFAAVLSSLRVRLDPPDHA